MFYIIKLYIGIRFYVNVRIEKLIKDKLYLNWENKKGFDWKI